MTIIKTTHVDFVKSATGTESLPLDSIPHIVIGGRSNVGKSTTLNAMLGRGIARSSGTPGKTREMNFFIWEGKVVKEDIEEEFQTFVVDLPGYGYAKMSKADRDKMLKRSLHYLQSYEGYIKVVGIVIDSKVGLTPYDQEFIDLVPESIPILIIANKMDKLNQKLSSALHKSLHASGFQTIAISALKGKNIEKLRALILGEEGGAYV